jgi:hypothetical protein
MLREIAPRTPNLLRYQPVNFLFYQLTEITFGHSWMLSQNIVMGPQKEQSGFEQQGRQRG